MNKKNNYIVYILSTIAIVGISAVAYAIYKKNKKSTKKSGSKNIIIGDSQTPFIDNQSAKANRLSESAGENSLWKSGMGLSWLKNAVDKQSVDKDVSNVIVNIGTNGGFNPYEDIDGLFKSLKSKFPNANFYAVKGSWGWGGNSNITESQVNQYYDKFKKYAKVLNPAIGKVKDPHGNLPIYKEIGKAIDNEL
jgi:hypothetical protein